MFELHHKLAEDCFQVGNFPLCRLLMINDSNYPWFILVPRVNGVSEIYQLSTEDQTQLVIESSVLSKTLSSMFDADKMNIAALGNVVPQLHIHHIVRYKNDSVWPDPVWGKVPSIPYGKLKRDEIMAKFETAFPIQFEVE